jgi:hypothetical protein
VHGRNSYRILIRKLERKRLPGSSRCRWEDNIRMDLRETGWGGVEWIHTAQDKDKWRAVVNTGKKPSSSLKGGEFHD